MAFAERQRVLVRWSRDDEPEEAYAARVLEIYGELVRNRTWAQSHVRVEYEIDGQKLQCLKNGREFGLGD